MLNMLENQFMKPFTCLFTYYSRTPRWEKEKKVNGLMVFLHSFYSMRILSNGRKVNECLQ